ncbi:MAG: 8-amino-7-oxononanoate synthase [Armatimonadetes bacterium]|nr:8-amino-7-oxononanoate synthase [Armatimonadota bacterium]
MADLDSRSLRRHLRSLTGPQDTWITIDSKWCLNLSSNNYLGLADHPLVVEAAQNCLAEFGAGAGGSRLISGNLELSSQLEKRLAEFKHCEDSIVFPTGYMANLGTLTSLATKSDLVILDKLNHASLIDAARNTGATIRVYQHLDVKKLTSILACSGEYRRKFVVTDAVFSVDGDLAPLPDLLDIAEQHGAILIVDDAHGTGVMGASGRGTVEHFGLDPRSLINIGTLGKAFGSLGGFVCGSKVLVDYLRNRARTFIYTTGLPASVVGAALAALELAESGDGLRQQLRRNSRQLIEGLAQAKIDAPHRDTPIVPIIVGDSEAAVQAAQKLFEAGVYCPALRPPTVPEGTARLRVSLMATHTEEDIKLAVETLAQVLSANQSGGS